VRYFPHLLKVRSFFWLFAALVTILLNAILARYPDLVEYGYSRGVFLWIRSGLDGAFGWLPFPMIYLWVMFLLFLLFRIFFSSWRHPLLLVKRMVSLVSVIVVLFYVLWGFNYQRQPIEHVLGLSPVPLSADDLCEALEHETTALQHLFLFDSTLIPDADLEQLLRKKLYAWSATQRIPVAGRVRAYPIYPDGIFLRFSSSGLYFPFSGQGQVDAGLHPLEWPWVMSHEMGHGLGYGDEGTCNFLAYLTTTHSDNPYIRYAGHLSYWRILAAHYRRYRPEDFERILSLLPQKTLDDLKAIYAALDKYPDFFPDFRNRMYNAYLKSQGIAEGIQNYNRVLMLTHAWYQKNGYQRLSPELK
jgi:hypothetical protein